MARSVTMSKPIIYNRGVLGFPTGINSCEECQFADEYLEQDALIKPCTECLAEFRLVNFTPKGTLQVKKEKKL